MREAFRLLYGCGLRVGELLQLVVGDVNLAEGVLTIRDGKFHKDRLVAIAPSLVTRLRAYDGAIAMGRRDRAYPFFPAPSGGHYTYTTLYHTFRLVLSIAGIAHGGRGAGPRLHDLRHTFAVHRLAAWYREGAELSARLPVLSTYMGHRSLHETDCYLRLTAELYPDLATRLEDAYGYLIPREVAQ
jgi:integrase